MRNKSVIFLLLNKWKDYLVGAYIKASFFLLRALGFVMSSVLDFKV